MTRSVPFWFGELHVGDVMVGGCSLGCDYTDRWRGAALVYRQAHDMRLTLVRNWSVATPPRG